MLDNDEQENLRQQRTLRQLERRFHEIVNWLAQVSPNERHRVLYFLKN